MWTNSQANEGQGLLWVPVVACGINPVRDARSNHSILHPFFKRRGGAKTLSKVAGDYQPGDVVSWRLTGGGLPHIGVVTRKKLGDQPLVAHNIGAGTQEEPCLFNWPMQGWFRFSSWT